MRYNRLDNDLNIDPKDRKPIILYINSPGGDVSSGYGLIDAILTSETPVWTVNQALCASMGFLIYIAGHKRYSMPHSQFLLHDGSVFAFDSTEKARDRMEFQTVQIEGMTKKFVVTQTNISEELYDNKHRTEWWMLPQEAKSLGVVHYIVGEDCTINTIV
jgi:ATP-dependent Clp protease protease subunit